MIEKIHCDFCKKWKATTRAVRGGGDTKAITEGNMDGKRGRGTPAKCWIDWLGRSAGELTRRMEDREQWRLDVKKALLVQGDCFF